MSDLLDSPEARFNAALSLATSEFQANLDQQGYEKVPTPHYSDIYATQYFKLVEGVAQAVRKSKDLDMLYHELIDLAHKRAETTNGEAIEAGKFNLAKQLGSYPDKMPDAHEREEIKRLWKKAK